MRESEIHTLKRIRDFMKGQFIRNNEPRTVRQIAANLALTATFRHTSPEKLYGLIVQAVMLFDDEFKQDRKTGSIERREPKWWVNWKNGGPGVVSGRTAEAIERREV